MATATRVNVTRFKNRCFVGLNRVEYYPDSGEMLFADNWKDVTDDQSRRNLLLGFFAPRDIDGADVDPAAALSPTDNEEDQLILAHHGRSIALFDFCRATKMPPNTLNVMIVADIIFHWDIVDSYIQPTSEETWLKDLQQVFKAYPKTTKKTVYTNWESDKKEELDATFFSLDQLPLDTDMWLNKPTIQERFGWPILLMGIGIAAGAYFLIDEQETQIREIRRQAALERQASGFGEGFRRIVTQVQEQEQFMRYRYLYSTILKDIAMATHNSEFIVNDFKVENPTPNIPNDVALVTISSKPNAYQGYLEQEPIARELLKQSVTLSEIRKPPIDRAALTLEGLVLLDELDASIRKHSQEMKLMRDISSPTKAQPTAKKQDVAKPQDSQEGAK
jgi:hypothetical protein